MPFPPGGVTDVVARLMAERLSAEFGQQVVVDNKTGAGGVIAGEIVAKAPPDGYTLLLTTPNHTINAAFRVDHAVRHRKRSARRSRTSARSRCCW